MSIYEPTHTRECPHRLDSWSSKPCVCAAVERAQRDDEAWMHAACLSIAEGVPDWEKPLEHDSLAMRTVRALRVKYEESAHSLEVLAAENATLRERVESLEKSLARAQELSAQELRIHQAMVQAIAYRPDPGYTEEAARHAEEIARLNAAKADEIKLRREVAQERDAFQSSAERLWQLLDRIDTLDDACRSDDALFRKLVRDTQQMRLQIAKSNDGQRLVWSHGVITTPPASLTDLGSLRRLARPILIPPRQGFMTFALAEPGSEARPPAEPPRTLLDLHPDDLHALAVGIPHLEWVHSSTGVGSFHARIVNAAKKVSPHERITRSLTLEFEAQLPNGCGLGQTAALRQTYAIQSGDDAKSAEALSYRHMANERVYHRISLLMAAAGIANSSPTIDDLDVNTLLGRHVIIHAKYVKYAGERGGYIVNSFSRPEKTP